MKAAAETVCRIVRQAKSWASDGEGTVTQSRTCSLYVAFVVDLRDRIDEKLIESRR